MIFSKGIGVRKSLSALSGLGALPGTSSFLGIGVRRYSAPFSEDGGTNEASDLPRYMFMT
jgi:hypothetical protein